MWLGITQHLHVHECPAEVVAKRTREPAEWDVDDPRLAAVADRLVAMFEEDAERWNEDQAVDFALDAELVGLLDVVFVDAVLVARRLLCLLEDRGRTGWTQPNGSSSGHSQQNRRRSSSAREGDMTYSHDRRNAGYWRGGQSG